MTIDPNKQYRTRDGRDVRIYAVDHATTFPICGAIQEADGWKTMHWREEGVGAVTGPDDLIEVTLADELRDQIPWSALRPEIRWVAMDGDGSWWAHHVAHKPEFCPSRRAWIGYKAHLSRIIAMPEVDPARWRETLVSRPEDT